MDASSALDIDTDGLDTGITAGPSTIIPVNISNDGVFLIASPGQVGVQSYMFYPTETGGTAATPIIEDMYEVPSHGITMNKPIAKGGTAAKPATEATFEVYP